MNDRKAVIFDMDGVLVASGPAHMASWRMAAKQHGRQISEEQFHASFGKTSREIIRTLWGDVPDDAVRQIDDEKEAFYRELITGMVPLMVGLRECLAGLHQDGWTLAVGTSGPPENVALVLGETGLADAFTAIVTGNEVTHGKPAPDIYALAAERCGIPADRCVVVEDAPVGIQAAHAAGIKAVGLVGTHPRAALEAARADRVVDGLRELTGALAADLIRT